MVRRGVGSNQYRTRAGQDLDLASDPDLIAQLTGPDVERPQFSAQVERWIKLVDTDDCLYRLAEYARNLSDSDLARLKFLACLQPDVASAVLERSNLPSDIIQAAMAAPGNMTVNGMTHRTVRQAAARHPACPPNLLRILACDRHVDVWEIAVQNPQCPPDLVLNQLRIRASFQDPQTREAVAKHRMTPLDILLQLVNDPEPPVRQAAAGNPNLPEEYKALSRAVSTRLRHI